MRTTIACLFAASTAAVAAPPAGPGLSVIPSGSEQALKLGDTVIPRPFGAQLVDGMSVVGRYGGARDRFYLVEGAGGPACPARYIVLHAIAGKPPLASAPFGTCGVGATGRLDAAGLTVAVAPGAGGSAPVRYLYAGGSVHALDPVPVTGAAALPVRCKDPDRLAAADRADVRGQLDRTLPPAFQRSGGLRHATLAPVEIDRMVAGLACLSAWPGADRLVARAATPLFASKAYGAASFGALDRFAAAAASDVGLRAAARSFAAAMHYQLAKREPV